MSGRPLLPRSWKGWTFCALGLVVGLIALVWLFRASLAGYAVRQWCEGQGLTCRAEIERLDLDRITINAIELQGSGTRIPFAARRLEVALDWPGAFEPKVQSITLESPVLRGEVGRDSASFGGLERIQPAGGGGGGPPPRVSISDARIELDTPAGPVQATGSVEGQFPSDFRLRLDLEPTRLETSTARLDLRGGMVELQLAGMKAFGRAELDLVSARYAGVTARDLDIEAELTGALSPRLKWSASGALLSTEDYELEDFRGEGDLALRRLPLNPDDELPALLSSFRADLSAVRGRLENRSTGPIEVSLDGAAARSDQVEGEGAIEVEDVSAPEGALGSGSVRFNYTLARDLSRLRLEGNAAVSAAQASETLRTEWLAPLKADAPLSAHAAALREAISRALSDFDADSRFTLTHTAGDGLFFATASPVSLRAQSGLSLVLEPRETTPAVRYNDATLRIAGALETSGGGMPAISADIEEAALGSSGVALSLGQTQVASWRAGGLGLSGDFDRVTLSPRAQGGDLDIAANGRLGWSGALFGMEFRDTRLTGGLLIGTGADGLSARTDDGSCLELRSSGLSIAGTVNIGGFQSGLCPENGAIFDTATGDLGGTIGVRDLSLPLSFSGTDGRFDLAYGDIVWAAEDDFTLSVSGTKAALPLALEGGDLAIDAASLDATLIARDPLSLEIGLEDGALSGGLVPARIRYDALNFEGTLGEAGLSGKGRADAILISDTNEDPFYEPFTADLEADIEDNRIALSGPVALARSEREIARAEMTLDLSTLSGEGSVVTDRLEFARPGLQPTELSDRVRGFLSNARGALQGRADMVIDGGDLEASGAVEAFDFGFDTLRVGAVEGVSGRIVFSDLFSLSTPPGQEVRIGRINPGVELRDGLLVFQLNDGRQARIETARWPFAGGELSVSPTNWSVAGTSDIIRVNADNIELTRLIDVLSVPDLEAEGTVSGSFPIELDGPNVYIRDARLTASEEGGRLSYTGKVAEQAASTDERVNYAFEALKNFQFSLLELGVNGDLTGDVLVSLTLRGKSPDVLGGASFDFNIGVDSKLAQLIRSGRSMVTSEWLGEVVTRQVLDPDTETGANGDTDSEDE